MLSPTTAAILALSVSVCHAQFTLNVVHWSDLHGRMTPWVGRGAELCADASDPDQVCYGGLARIASVCKAQKAADNNTLCLDGGDVFSGTYWTDNDADFSYVEAMNGFVDVSVLGNHDFDKGIDYLVQYLDTATFPVLGACNMDLSGEPRLESRIDKWATFTMGGQNVAIIGYTNEEESSQMTEITGNITFSDAAGSSVAGVAAGGLIGCISAFRAENPGNWLIGVLSHGGIDVDQKVIEEVYPVQGGVSFVVGGHSHEPFYTDKLGPCMEGIFNATTQEFACDPKGRDKSRYQYPLPVQTIAGSLALLHSGWAGEFVGTSTFVYSTDVAVATAVTGFIQPLGLSFQDDGTQVTVPDDPDTVAILAADAAAVTDFQATVLGTMPLPLAANRPDIFIREGPAGWFICNSLIWFASNVGISDDNGGDPVICLLNAATIRRALAAGPVTVAATRLMLPPEEDLTMTVIQITGAQLKQALENSVSHLNSTDIDPDTGNATVPDGRYLHIGGGLSFSYDLTKAPYRFNSSDEVVLQEGSRVTKVQHDCKDIADDDTIRVVTNSQLPLGVDDYFMMEDHEKLLTYGPLLGDAVGRFIRASSGTPESAVPQSLINMPSSLNQANCTPTEPLSVVAAEAAINPLGPTGETILPPDISPAAAAGMGEPLAAEPLAAKAPGADLAPTVTPVSEVEAGNGAAGGTLGGEFALLVSLLLAAAAAAAAA